MRGLVVLLTLVAAVAAVPLKSQRIIGGSLTTINQYPEIVALLFSLGTTNHRQACAGTILNTRSVLTAAHCPMPGDPPYRWRLRVGSSYANSDGQLLSSAQIIHHPQYNRWTLDNDIAVIHTASTIGFNNVVRPASIASVNYNLDDNQDVWAAGWGRTSFGAGAFGSEQLRHVQIWTVNQQTCRLRYATIGLQVTDNMLCSGWLDVGGRDQCQGDSGGPLYHNGVVVGICSWGAGCAEALFPGVNARVSRYNDWIRSNA